MNWLKEHWEIISAAVGFGGLLVKHNDVVDRVGKLEEDDEKRILNYHKDILEIKTNIATLLERTK